MNRVHPRELRIIEKYIKDSDVVFDVGACEGEWSQAVLQTHKNTHIHCFEPIPDSFIDLIGNFRLYSNITINNLGISNKKEEKTFYWYNGISNSGNPAKGLSGYFRRIEEIETMVGVVPTILHNISVNTLDNYCAHNNIERINFLKIDTEGADFDVIKGAERLMKNQKVDYIEFEYGGCWQENNKTLRSVFNYAKEHGYRLFKIADAGLISIDELEDFTEDFVFELFLLIREPLVKKEVLVTGGAGFIGSHLMEELVKNKNYNITIVDDLSTGKMSNIGKFLFSNNVFFMLNTIQDAEINKKFDIIYHLGAKANTREKGMKDFIDNVRATEAVVKLLKRNGSIYFSSSCAVYGDQKLVTEESSFHPISPYGYSKLANELTIKSNCKNYTIFRFSNVFGERQDGSNEMGLIGVIEYHLKNNKKMQVFNQGKNHRDYIYVKDVVNALLTMKKREVFQIGSCKLYNTLDLVKLSGVDWSYGSCNNEVNSIKLDNTKLKKEGWKPTLSVIQYIKGLKK